MSNREPYTDGPAERGWSAGSIAAAVVAMILVIAAISYAINNNSTSTASGPSATGAGSSTVGQGTEQAQPPVRRRLPVALPGRLGSHASCSRPPPTAAIQACLREPWHVAHAGTHTEGREEAVTACNRAIAKIARINDRRSSLPPGSTYRACSPAIGFPFRPSPSVRRCVSPKGSAWWSGRCWRSRNGTSRVRWRGW